MTKQEIDLLRKIADDAEAELKSEPRTNAPQEGEECLLLWGDGQARPVRFNQDSRDHRAYLASGSLVWGPDREACAEWILEQRRRIPRCPPPFKNGQTVYALHECGSTMDGWRWVGDGRDFAHYRAGGLFATEAERDAEAARRSK